MTKFIQSEKFFMPIVYVGFGIIIYLIIAKIIDDLSKINIKHVVGKESGIDKRKKTVINLFKNIIKYIIAIIVIVLILNLYGVNTTSIIASIGVAGAVIGLAFQDILKDFLAGIFIIFDNAYAVGDWVEINGFKGEVISLGLKTTKVKAYTGEVMILSNSSFNKVVNYNLNHTKLILTLPVAYNTKIEDLENILNGLKEEIVKKKYVYSMELLGVDEFADSSINYAIMIDCAAMKHVGIKREVLKLIKVTFDKEGIEIPYQKIDINIEK